MMRGRGERIAPVHVVTTWWAVKPFGFPTRSPDAYRWWDEDGASVGPDPGALVAAAETGNVELLGHALFNDLEGPVSRAASGDRGGEARVPGRGGARRDHERQRPDGRRAGEPHGPRRPAGGARFRGPSSCRGRRRDNRRAVRGRLTARRGPLEPEMEVRFLPPEQSPGCAPAAARLPASPASRNMEALRPLDARLAENTKNAPNARRGGARGRQGQTAEVLDAQGPASHLRPARAVARAAGRRRHPSEQDRRGRRARRRRRPRGGAVVGTEARARLRRADRAARNGACGAGRGAGGGPRAGRAGGRGRLRPGDRATT